MVSMVYIIFPPRRYNIELQLVIQLDWAKNEPRVIFTTALCDTIIFSAETCSRAPRAMKTYGEEDVPWMRTWQKHTINYNTNAVSHL